MRRLVREDQPGGDAYTVADMAVWPWYGTPAAGKLYDAGEFLDAQSYEHIQRWTGETCDREPVKRGRMVNRAWGDPATQLHERHSAEDLFEDRRTKAPRAFHCLPNAIINSLIISSL